MPDWPPAASLERIPLAGSDRPTEKFSLADLADFGARSVDEVIAQSVAEHLERSSFNHPGEIVDLLAKIGVDL